MHRVSNLAALPEDSCSAAICCNMLCTLGAESECVLPNLKTSITYWWTASLHAVSS